MLTEPQEEALDLTPLNIIRTETVLSRYPIHRLAKRGNISIEIKKQGQGGEVLFNWEVSHNSRHGQPGPLAYKVDTLIINRRIDEARRPLPQVICLGSLRDICEELGLHASGQNIAHLKRALRQNAFAAITAKVRYKGADGTERFTEINDTRYGVIFTGEKLPNGRRADAVYIVLHDFYREVLDNTMSRPLDYDYLKALPPAPQRLYELISYQVYAALKHKRPRAKYLYSEYCTYAPQTRYFDYEHVKKQMYKVHAPHRRSGYLDGVEFEAVTDDSGQPDWVMFYTPGRKAKAEHDAFSRRRQIAEPAGKGSGKALVSAEYPPTSNQPSASAGSIHEPEEELRPENVRLLSRLKSLGVSDKKARELVRSKPDIIERQLSALPYRSLEKGRKNPAGWIVAAIENDYELPEAYKAAVESELQAKKGEVERAKREACTFCGPSGFRYMKGRGVKKCSHNPAEESKYSGEPY
jgi:hypothetical protein